MEWKDTNLNYETNCIFIDEAGFHINMRNNWARSDLGTPAKVTIPKTRSPSHTIIGVIHSSCIMHITLKKRHKKKLQNKSAGGSQKKKKINQEKKRTANKFIAEKPTIEYVDIEENTAEDSNAPAAKGTATAHFIKSMNELLDIIDLDESWQETYLAMDNCIIHKSKPMIRKIPSKRYRVMYLASYSPELNPIEQFWNAVTDRLKQDRLMTEENISSKIGDACNNVQ